MVSYDKKSQIEINTNDGDAFLINDISSNHKSTIVLLPNNKRIQQLKENLEFCAGDDLNNNLQILTFPEFDVSELYGSRPSNNVLIDRINCLTELIELNKSKKRTIIIATVKSIIIKTIPKDFLMSLILNLKVGQKIQSHQLAENLVEIGYTREEIVMAPNQFAVNGGIIEIYTSLTNGYRIYFDEDSIENIKTIDPATKKSNGSVDEVVVKPFCEIFISDKTAGHLIDNIDKIKNEDIEQIQTSLDMKDPQMLFPYFTLLYKKPNLLFDYVSTINNDCCVVKNDLTDDLLFENIANYEQQNSILSPKEDTIASEDELSELMKKVKQYVFSFSKSV